MSKFELKIPAPIREFLSGTIAQSGGNEVFFLGHVRWSESDGSAELAEVDVFARGNEGSTPAIIEGSESWDVAIHNHPGGNLTPSPADIDVASELGNRQVGFVIIDNEATQCYVVVPPFKRQHTVEIDPAEVTGILSEGGALERLFEKHEGPGSYEVRPGQIGLSQQVTRAINENGIMALEAGTGVGKSFAYLVPAILWAVRNKKRVIISTNTINLQEQLVAKDLPLLEDALDEEFSYALIKGRNNYACRRKTGEVGEDLEAVADSEDDERLLGDLVKWVSTTEDGSLGDLAMRPPEEIWEKVMSESDRSLNVNCPHYQTCFYYQAKRRAFKAQILVVNHHLFFADLAVRRETGNYQWDLILPGYDRVVFDEGHHLEDVASRHLGVRFTRQGIERRMSRLVSRKNPSRGTLPALARKLRKAGAIGPAEIVEQNYVPQVPKVAEKLVQSFGDLSIVIDQFQLEADSIGRAAATPVAAQGNARWTSRQIRMTTDAAQEILRREVSDTLAQVARELGHLAAANDRALRAIKAAPLNNEIKTSLLVDLTSLNGRLDRLIDSMRFFSDFSDDSQVRWLEVRSQNERPMDARITFSTSPIHVGAELQQAVYEPMKSVVLTSATLSVANRIDFFRSRVGLDRVEPERFHFESFPSPFDFQRQARTLIPTDFPEPSHPRFEARVIACVGSVLERLRGRTFVLFTSYALLKRVHTALERRAEGLGIRILCQGDTNRTELLERFRRTRHNVLFGTDSFWEGVDVKGRGLECVVITRLPFRVPSEPLQVARVERLEKQGISAFQNFSIPQAVLKFKQGFGRLIRSHTDRGVVLVLDSRLVTKRYGRLFLDSIPPARLVMAPESEVLEEIEKFFE
jgi:ATP-dependent DNA helicase DinG